MPRVQRQSADGRRARCPIRAAPARVGGNRFYRLIKNRRCASLARKRRERSMAPSPQTPGNRRRAAGAEALAANFADIAPPLHAARGAGRGRPLLFLLRRALHHGLPDLDRHPALHPRDRRRAAPRRRRETILEQNILGGMCARVCPTETLCEEACVREAAEGKPVEIGRLQRFATDALMARGPPALRAGRADRQAGRGGRRRAGGPRLRAPAGDARPRRHAARRARKGRRPQRVRHRGLQGGGRISPRPRSTGCSGSAGSTVRYGKALGRDVRSTTLRGGYRRGLPRDRARRRHALGAEGADARGRAAGGRLHRRAAPGGRPGGAAGRAAGRGHRRRHDRDRRRRCRRSCSARRR